MKSLLPLLLVLSPVRFLQAGPELLSDAAYTFDMGTERRNWTHAKWAVTEFDTPIDLSGADGLALTVLSPTPRRDAGVTVALREADGSWYSHPWATDLSAERNTGFALFRHFSPPAYHQPPKGDFKDENNRFDPEAVTAIAIGVVNPLGIGEVAFTVERVEAGPSPHPLPAATPLDIEVTGRLKEINGTRFLPAGVFGSFNLKSMKVDGETVERTERYRLAMDRRIDFSGYGASPAYGSATTPMMVLAVGDRTQPSKRLTDADWRERYAESGASLGRKAVEDGRTAYVEFWNEPYLNWANDNRKNFDPDFFNRAEAEEGGVVKIRHDGEVMPHLKWTRDFTAPGWDWTRNGLREWRRGRDEQGRWTVSEHARLYKTPRHEWDRRIRELNPPEGVADGETYEADGRTFTAFTPWHVYDETQFTYWSGRGMLKPYIEPLLAYATAIKEVAGDRVQIIAGWGNRPSEDHWAAFEMLYKPTIDAAHEVIDGYNDHDYGADPRLMPANYEVMTGYGMVEHGKWLHAYNTETASNADPQAHSGQVQLSGDANKFLWVSRKIAAVLEFSPDKCRALAHFGVGGGFWSDQGEGVAMDLMRNLRGRMVETVDADPEVYVVSAIDGTDPMAPRPDDLPDRQELTTLVLNDGPVARTARLRLAPPAGTRFTDATVARGAPDWSTGKVEIQTRPLEVSAEGASLTLELEPGIPHVVTIGLEGEVAPDAPAEVVETQRFGDAILEPVVPDQAVRTTIPTPGSATPRRAWLRFVAERLSTGEGEVLLNGVAIPLPPAVAAENHALLREMEIDPTLLREENTLEFRVKDGDAAGFLLGISSLIAEADAP